MKTPDELLMERILSEMKSDDKKNSAFVKNQVGCHYNLTGMNISDGEVLDFSNHVIKFTEYLICNNCGQMPDKNTSESYWQCTCGGIELWPLQEPR